MEVTRVTGYKRALILSTLFLWFFRKFLRSEQPLIAPMTARGWLQSFASAVSGDCFRP